MKSWRRLNSWLISSKLLLDLATFDQLESSSWSADRFSPLLTAIDGSGRL